ncbi:helix-turn-helix domain-containing protein [Streptomyces sp. NPDC005708]|uniref:helix-turn-helix domain-containing protein n=1 Tax=Streptomyces sp. NPDC005708 TaxID=3154564 RepID=UPI00340E1FF3
MSTKPARRLLPGPERDKVAAGLKAEYEAGTSVRRIAEATGRSYGAVHRLLAEAGVQFRPRGGAAGDAVVSTDAG